MQIVSHDADPVAYLGNGGNIVSWKDLKEHLIDLFESGTSIRPTLIMNQIIYYLQTPIVQHVKRTSVDDS
jgi:hypothetical protein